MKKVIVLGSLNMDMAIEVDQIPKEGETISGKHFITNAGGKGANQAVAAAKLGAQTYMIGKVGEDAFGEELVRQISKYGVKPNYIHKSTTCKSGVAMVIRHEGDNRIILNHGANYDIEEAFAEEALEEIGVEGDIFLTQFECNYEVIKKAIKIAKDKKMFTILNPAPAKMIDQEILSYIDLLVINQTECEIISEVYPTDRVSCEKAIAIIKKKGVKNCIITLGVEGSVVENNGELLHVPSQKVKAIDTTAAGDTYIGALAAQLTQDKTLFEAMEFGTLAAALTVTKVGAQQSIPYLNEVLQSSL